VGKGIAVYATNREDPARGVNNFFRYIDRSVLRDVSIDWGGYKVSEVTPGELPDLFASHPLIIHGRLAGKGSRAPVIHATSASGAIEIPVQVVAAKKSDKRDISGVLWARAKVTGLETDFASGDASAKAEITKLGVDFSLVTRFTSFVAVDSSRQVGNGDPNRVVQPVEQPEDVDLRAASPMKPKALEIREEGGRNADGVKDSEAKGEPHSRAETVMTVQASAPPSAEYKNGRGCACKLGDAESDSSHAGFAFLLAATIALARRRRHL